MRNNKKRFNIKKKTEKWDQHDFNVKNKSYNSKKMYILHISKNNTEQNLFNVFIFVIYF